KKTQSIFEAEVGWILESREQQNIVFVSHVGDIVNEYGSDDEWKIARKNMLKLRGEIPFGFSVGNHDMRSSGESKKFQNSFPASLFEDEEWYGGQIKNNANSFQ